MDFFWKDFFTSQQEIYDPRVELLKDCPLFSGLGEETYEDITQLLHERNYEKGETIFSRGDPASAVFLIEEGSVRIYRDEPDSPKRELAELEKDNFFGELAISEEHRRNASAEALEASKLHVLFRQEFMDFALRELDCGFEIILNLAQITGERLRKINDEYYKTKLKLEDMEAENES